MKRPRRRKVSEEDYWKSATDIMAGVLLVILLVLMLLLLYLTQLNKEKNKNTSVADAYGIDYEIGDDFQTTTIYNEHLNDHQYDEPPNDGGGGEGGGGDDDPGTEIPIEAYPDEGHDKAAVFVTIVDEETGNVIKKDGVLFELYADKNGTGGLQTLHTYYPEKIEYKQYKTTKNGTFYLPEKITRGWYSFHNLTPPAGYGKAENLDFEVTEPADWPEPYLVKIPFSPSKNHIFVRNIDSVTKKQVGDEVYEVYASEDIKTLDGTVRYKSGQKVDEIKCDKNGVGSSKKLYLGKYYLSQKTPAQYYARNLTKIDAEVKLTDTAEKNAVVIECEKTQITLTLNDEYSKEPIKDGEYTVTDKGALKTDAKGMLTVTDLDKDKEYTITLNKLPEPYRTKATNVKLTVDKDGNIQGSAVAAVKQTAYIIRLTIDVKDQIFGNSVSGFTFRLLNSKGDVVDEWDGNGSDHLTEGIEPGDYMLETNGDSSSQKKITVRDQSGMQSFVTKTWTTWDTVLIIGCAIGAALFIFITIRVILYLRKRKKKVNGQQKNTVEKK